MTLACRAGAASEHEVVVGVQCSRWESRASASAAAGAKGAERTRPLFGDVSARVV